MNYFKRFMFQVAVYRRPRWAICLGPPILLLGLANVIGVMVAQWQHKLVILGFAFGVMGLISGSLMISRHSKRRRMAFLAILLMLVIQGFRASLVSHNQHTALNGHLPQLRWFVRGILGPQVSLRRNRPAELPHPRRSAASLARHRSRDQIFDADVALEMIKGIDRFLMHQLKKSVTDREKYWDRDFSSFASHQKSLSPNRQRLAQILGLRDPRNSSENLEYVATTSQPALVGQGDGFRVLAVRWNAFGHVQAEGLLLVPTVEPPIAYVIAVPDAEQTPEQLVCLVKGIPRESQFARRLAENKCLVLVPSLLSRKFIQRANTKLTKREFVYRSAFVLGRHIIGYEIQKILAAADFFENTRGKMHIPIGIMGYGEGGLLALYSAALDTRFESTCVSGYFDSRQQIWKEPADRNVFGLLHEFGDAEIASMIAPRTLIVEAARAPEIILPKHAGSPGRLITPSLHDVKTEIARAQSLLSGIRGSSRIQLAISGKGQGPFGTQHTLEVFLNALSKNSKFMDSGSEPITFYKDFNPKAREDRQLYQLDQHNQWILQQGHVARWNFRKNLDFTSLAHYEQTLQAYRQYFHEEVMGCFNDPLSAPNPRIRQTLERDSWIGYEIILDVFPDVIAFGLLLVPKDLYNNPRPVVVCQHGLENRPQDLVEPNNPMYKGFAAKLADRGFVVFCPQNPYIFGDSFRILQRKAHPIKKSLFSIIIAQHQQILNWLKTLSFVDQNRIGFYGISYGGKTAMRVPAVLTDYDLSICSGDFTDAIWKAASSMDPYTFVWTDQYEVFEFNLGNTFNYAEMAMLISPRPFMVERGHLDGVSNDERTAAEFARTQLLYTIYLGIPERCEIDWFAGGHEIHGEKTFAFLHRHLKWPP